MDQMIMYTTNSFEHLNHQFARLQNSISLALLTTNIHHSFQNSQLNKHKKVVSYFEWNFRKVFVFT